MYAAYFGLKQEPFSIAPDPRLLFMSAQHREALAHLLYGLGGGGGFVLLTGGIGTGKTTLVRSFLEQAPALCNLAYIFNPRLTVQELLETVCEEFGVELPGNEGASTKQYVDALNDFLLAAHAEGRNSVLVIDEAQNLSPDVLEQLRLLTNLETSERKLLQIILVGQPELRAMLDHPQLEQLAQRVVARFHLGALSAEETGQYIRHRLDASGLQGPPPFDPAAFRTIHRITNGVPRRINLLCDRALLGAYATGQARVDSRIVQRAAKEVFDAGTRTPVWRRPVVALGVGAIAGAGLLAAANHATRTPLVEAPGAAAVVAAVPAPTAPRAEPPARAPVLLNDERQAWRELARAWNVSLPADAEPCEALRRERLFCFDRALSLATIRQLARPGILTLDVASGKPSFAILTALDESTATLTADGTQQTVTLGALAKRWEGDFATLWRAPAGYNGERLQDNARGEVVDWLAATLATTTGQGSGPLPNHLNPELKAQVRTFQVAHGLPADGRPGPLTFMQLNRIARVEEPRLRARP